MPQAADEKGGHIAAYGDNDPWKPGEHAVKQSKARFEHIGKEKI